MIYKKEPHLGTIGTPPPANYTHPLQIKEYLESEYSKTNQIHIVGETKCLGRAWRHGPIHFELYVSDIEPTIISTPHFRIILWQPITKLETPKHWHHLWFPTEISRQIGFAQITGPSYWRAWTKNAQRDRTIWLNNKEFEIITSDYLTFLREYPCVGTYKPIRQVILNILKNKIDHLSSSIHFFAAQHIKSNKISAMVALIKLPHVNKAIYLSAFVKPEWQHSLCSTGLIDHCFRFCLEHNIEFLDFGAFWAPGSPSSWKGFSRFKQKFGVTLIRYPSMLWRVIKKSSRN